MPRDRNRPSTRRRYLQGAGTPPRASCGFPHTWREGAERFTASASFYFPSILLPRHTAFTAKAPRTPSETTEDAKSTWGRSGSGVKM